MNKLLLGISVLSFAAALVVAETPDTTKKTDAKPVDKVEKVAKPTEKTDKAVKPAEKKEEMITMKNGLRYIDHKVGTGAEAATGKRISVNYTGWFDKDGKHGESFDSSRKPGRGPYTLTLGNHEVIDGWDQGIVGMKVGGIRELFIPSALAYGKRGFPGAIPPDANLIFELELMDCK